MIKGKKKNNNNDNRLFDWRNTSCCYEVMKQRYHDRGIANYRPATGDQTLNDIIGGIVATYWRRQLRLFSIFFIAQYAICCTLMRSVKMYFNRCGTLRRVSIIIRAYLSVPASNKRRPFKIRLVCSVVWKIERPRSARQRSVWSFFFYTVL